MFIIRTVRLLEISCCLCHLVCQLTLIVFAPFLLLIIIIIIIIILLLFLSVDHEIVHGRSQELPVLSVEF
jgi:fatty acid desaturase